MNSPDLILKKEFVANADALFRQLRNSVQWDERMRARKTASFGVAYNYSQISYPFTPMPTDLQVVCEAIKGALGFTPNNCLLNFYPDSDSSMGFHSDTSEELEAGTGVAIVSLGSVRTIIYRSKHDKSIEASYALDPGSLLFMSNAVQDGWLHAIPKQAGAGERISLTFRRLSASPPV